MDYLVGEPPIPAGVVVPVGAVRLEVVVRELAYLDALGVLDNDTGLPVVVLKDGAGLIAEGDVQVVFPAVGFRDPAEVVELCRGFVEPGSYQALDLPVLGEVGAVRPDQTAGAVDG